MFKIVPSREDAVLSWRWINFASWKKIGGMDEFT